MILCRERKAETMFEYRLEHIMSFTVKIAEPEVIGPVPEGLRINGYISGGEVTGPRVSRAVGGDWLTVRKDGVAIIDVRATIEAHDGPLIGLSYWGVLDMGSDGYEQFLQGRPPANGTAIRVSARLSASHPDYTWLNRLHCLGIGEAYLERSQVGYDVYAVR
jgi:Protein of unknown function (DUF3237)